MSKSAVEATRNAKPRDLVPAFARLVTRARVARLWSQNELARQADVSPMCISDLENMKRSPSLRVAAQIARALKLPILLARPGRLPNGFQLIQKVNRTGHKMYVRKRKQLPLPVPPDAPALSA